MQCTLINVFMPIAKCRPEECGQLVIFYRVRHKSIP